MKRSGWFRVIYKDEDGYLHDDLVRGLKEAKALAKHYKVGFESIN